MKHETHARETNKISLVLLAKYELSACLWDCVCWADKHSKNRICHIIMALFIYNSLHQRLGSVSSSRTPQTVIAHYNISFFFYFDICLTRNCFSLLFFYFNFWSHFFESTKEKEIKMTLSKEVKKKLWRNKQMILKMNVWAHTRTHTRFSVGSKSLRSICVISDCRINKHELALSLWWWTEFWSLPDK